MTAVLLIAVGLSILFAVLKLADSIRDICVRKRRRMNDSLVRRPDAG
jgi:hypothetical protein